MNNNNWFDFNLLCVDKNAFDGQKWTNNEKKSKSINDNGTTDEKKCENGGCSDSSISTTDQKTTTLKEKVRNIIHACCVTILKIKKRYLFSKLETYGKKIQLKLVVERELFRNSSLHVQNL